MINHVDGVRIRIRRGDDGFFFLTCHEQQVVVLSRMWRQHDFPLFGVRRDAVTSGGEPDAQVTVLFGRGDPIDQYQPVLDEVAGNGLS